MWIPRWAKPYMGKIKTISSDAAIWGPNVGGEYIYLYASKNRRYRISARTLFPEWITSGTPTAKRKTSRWTCLSCSPIYAIALKTI